MAILTLRKQVSFVEKMLFTKHLSTMLHAGVPLAEAIEALMDARYAAALTNILKQVIKDVQNGMTLAKSLGRFPKVFTPFYLSLVEVGEKSGNLEENLKFLADHLDKEHRLKQKIQGALFYPALVFTAAVAMSGFISIFILPQLVTFFDSFDIELPITTRILLAVAQFMSNWGVVFFASLILGIFLIISLLNTKWIKPHWHSWMLKVPLFGRMLLYSQLTRFSRNMAIMIRSGIPINEALVITSRTMSNLRINAIMHQLNASLAKGVNLSDALHRADIKEYPPIAVRMIAVGEKTGKLETTLLYLADFYEDEIDTTTKRLTNILEPLLLLIIGSIVAFVALAIITPIYELTGSIRR